MLIQKRAKMFGKRAKMLGKRAKMFGKRMISKRLDMLARIGDHLMEYLTMAIEKVLGLKVDKAMLDLMVV